MKPGWTYDGRSRAALPTVAALREVADKLATDIEAGRVLWSSDPMVQLNATIDLIVMRDAAKLDWERRAIQLAELRKHLATGETALIEWKADEVIQSERLLVVKGSPAYRDLCQRLQRAQIEVLERAAERDAGNWSGVPSDPIVVPADLTQGKRVAAPGETLMELYDKFKTERLGDARPDTWDQNRKIVKLFAEFVGEASHVSVITRKAVRNWKQELARWPVKAADSKAFEGMSFRKVIEANETVKKPTISQNSINKYLAALGSFARWLLQNEYIDDDVMSGMYLSIDKRRKEPLPVHRRSAQDDLQLAAVRHVPRRWRREQTGQCGGARLAILDSADRDLFRCSPGRALPVADVRRAPTSWRVDISHY